ncbi:hypothetical protein [Streptomyces sp. NPDC057623]|uniref:hypothetical protein n=1 Tax=Streptomyces sp. NPDC057623 TaxID=3346187 RepID=UPI0036C58F7C
MLTTWRCSERRPGGRFTGRTAVVTGAASGIGAATAVRTALTPAWQKAVPTPQLQQKGGTT